jgi:hypothetical protein
MPSDDQEFFGPLDPVWLGDSDYGPRYIDVSTTRLYRDALYGKPRAVVVDQGISNAVLRVPLFSDSGSPLVIDVGSYSVAPTAAARYREAAGNASSVTDAEATLSSDGTTVGVELPTAVADVPGVYTVQFRVLDGGGYERARNELWVYVNRGLWLSDGSPGVDVGLPTIREVRNAVRDHPGANRLLGDYEFDAAEVASALVSAIQSFNNETPPIDRCFNTTSWPVGWRRALIDGALAYLFETASDYHRRGELPYSAAGVSINDLSKSPSYIQAAEAYRKRFSRWVIMTKSKISLSQGWGSLGSGYPGASTY